MIQALRSRLNGMRWRLAVAGFLLALAACVGPRLIDRASGPAEGEPVAKVVATLQQDFRPTSAAWSPDGKYLAVTGSSGTRTVNIWNVEQKKIEQTFELLEPPVPTWHSLGWSPDGRLLAVCQLGAVIWNTHTASVETRIDPLYLDPADNRVRSRAADEKIGACNRPIFTPDGKLLIISHGGAVNIHSTQDWSVTKRWKIPKDQIWRIEHMALRPNTSVLAMAVNGYWDQKDPEGRVLFWDYLAEVEPSSDFRPYPEWPARITSLAFSPDGQHLATGTNTGTGFDENNRNTYSVRLWRMSDRQLLAAPLDGKDHGHVHGLSYTPDGKYLIAGHVEREGTIHMLDGATGKVLHTVHGSPFVTCITVKPDSTLFASCGGSQLTVWSLKNQ